MAKIFAPQIANNSLVCPYTGKGTVVSGASPKGFKPIKEGNSYNLNGSYVSWANTETLTNSGDFTICIAFKSTDYTYAPNFGVSKMEYIAPNFKGWSIIRQVNGYINFTFGNGTNTRSYLYSGSDYFNKTTYFTATYNAATTTWICYINGVYYNTTVYAISPNTGKIYLGVAYNNSPGVTTANTYVPEIFIEDRILTASEVSKIYADFLHKGVRKSETNRRKSPVSINADEAGLIKVWKFVENSNPLIDIKTGATATKTNNPIWLTTGYNFVATSSQKITLGSIGNVKSIHMGIKLVSTTEKILEGAANNFLIYANAGTLSYTDYDNAFINGIDTDTITAGQWNDVLITSTTNVNITDVTLALNNATYGNLQIAFIKFYSNELTVTDAIRLNNQSAGQLCFTEDFSYGADEISKNIGSWIPVGTAVYKIGELSAVDVVLKQLKSATPYIQCVTAGVLIQPSNNVRGTLEFNFFKTDDSIIDIIFINVNKGDRSTATGYYLRINSNEGLYFGKVNSGSATTIFVSSVPYITANTWYQLRITIFPTGVFTFYIKGGILGNNWVLIPTSSGTNPTSPDVTYTTSKYFCTDLDAGDAITNIKWIQGILQ